MLPLRNFKACPKGLSLALARKGASKTEVGMGPAITVESVDLSGLAVPWDELCQFLEDLQGSKRKM